MSAGFAGFADGFAKGFGQTYSTIRQIQKDKEADEALKRQKAFEEEGAAIVGRRGQDIHEVDGQRFNSLDDARAYIDRKQPVQQPVATPQENPDGTSVAVATPVATPNADPYGVIKSRKYGTDDMYADLQASAAKNKFADKALALETSRRTARREGWSDAIDLLRMGDLDGAIQTMNGTGRTMINPAAKPSWAVDKDGKEDRSAIVLTMPDGTSVTKKVDDLERSMLGLKDRAAVKLSDAQAALAESRASGVETPEERQDRLLRGIAARVAGNKEVATIRADASRDVARTGADGRVQAAGITAGASERNSERAATSRVEAAGIAANAPSKSAGKSDTPKMKEARLAIADLEKQYKSLGRKTDDQSVKDRIAIRSKIEAWEAYRDGIRDGKPAPQSPAAKPAQEFDFDEATGKLVPRK